MAAEPAEGERRAIGGYLPQYLVSAALVLESLQSGLLDWIRVADPEAGRVDDLQIATPARLDAYQVKWQRYAGTMTLNKLVESATDDPCLFEQLASGWKVLQDNYPERRIVVHLLTNDLASSSPTAKLPETDCEPTPYHFAAFVAETWLPSHRDDKPILEDKWKAIWNRIHEATGLSSEDFPRFVRDCSLDFGADLPEQDTDVQAVCDLLISSVAAAERIVELNQAELLRRLHWIERYEYRNRHEFPANYLLYRPIRRTVDEVTSRLEELESGYIGVLGSPGSGKSTLLTQTLRQLPHRLVRYYAYVPETLDLSILRGESVNFLHDITLRLSEAGFCRRKRPDPTDRITLLRLFGDQLIALGEDFVSNGTKTVILVDGLDHIAREQNPERSLLEDLPEPDALPSGVYVVIGSQTDHLPGLSPQIALALNQDQRRVDMGRLSRSDVDAITAKATPHLDANERQRVLELTEGHPLALTYLLRSLRQADCPEQRAVLLDGTSSYTGDIEDQYESHWRRIEDNAQLVHALGLLARVRGPISMKWVAQWLDPALLKPLKRLLLTYFYEESVDSWTFFHNSFRLFLAVRTAEPLPGLSSGERNVKLHRELAERYEKSLAPWKWEALYHYYRAEDYDAVLQVATYQWFREQAEALQPLDTVQADIRLGIKAAGIKNDVVALGRLTLASASAGQRQWILKDSSLPELLLIAGQYRQAVEHVRDGYRLRVDTQQALHLSVLLHEAGFPTEGYRVFELAEPLEFLSGRLVSDHDARSGDFWNVIKEWLHAAAIYRRHDEVLDTIRRIRIEPGPQEKTSLEEASHELQNWLLVQAVRIYSARGDWKAWEAGVQLSEGADRSVKFFALVRSLQRAQETSSVDNVRMLIDRLLRACPIDAVLQIAESYSRLDACLSVTETLSFQMGDWDAAKTWMSTLFPVPLVDRDLRYDSGISLGELRFRWARMRYLLGDTREPRALLRVSEQHSEFGMHVAEEEKAAYRQLALAEIKLAHLWVTGYEQHKYDPVFFIHEVKWILDLVGRSWDSWGVSYNLGYMGGRRSIVYSTVMAAEQHGHDVLVALADELDNRWIQPVPAVGWSAGVQRDVVLALADRGAEIEWVRRQLSRIGALMLDGTDLHSRVEECAAHARAWLHLGDQDEGLSEIHRMVVAARGILSDKDYQLAKWVQWLRRVNQVEPLLAPERTRLMLSRLVSVRDSASGVPEAAEELLQVTFDWSATRSIRLLQSFMESGLVSHRAGLLRLLRSALSLSALPLQDVGYILGEMIIPLVLEADSDFLHELVTGTSKCHGNASALELAAYLARQTQIYAPADIRAVWNQGLALALDKLGFSLDIVGLQSADVSPKKQRYSGSEIKLRLSDGRQLSMDDARREVNTVDDLAKLLDQQSPEQGYFEWPTVFIDLANRMPSAANLGRLGTLARSQLEEDQLGKVLTALSKMWLMNDKADQARRLAYEAVENTQPSGWATRWYGDAKYVAMRQLVAVDPARARDYLVRLYSHDLGERLTSADEVIYHLYEALKLLTERVPVEQIWVEIEYYLDELFSALYLDAQVEEERSLNQEVDGEDTPIRAFAELLVLYLDHPSYVVAQTAVKACVRGLADGSAVAAEAITIALQRTDQTAERALMALEAASVADVSTARRFQEELEQQMQSPNFTLRLIASSVHARAFGQEITIPRVTERVTPALYALHLPQLSTYDTFEEIKGSSSPTVIGDPALLLSPLDMELRELAQLADLPIDNVLHQAARHYRHFCRMRTWLRSEEMPSPRRLTSFFDYSGLRYSHYKPQISPARQALAYVAGELYDASYLTAEHLELLWRMLVHHDPVLTASDPIPRPECIPPIGGIPIESDTYVSVPRDWHECAEESLPLLHLFIDDDRIIIGERTRLRYVADGWPTEERMSVTRPVSALQFWEDYDVTSGDPPFARYAWSYRVEEYQNIRADLSHLIISNRGVEMETPGASWIALNPVVGYILSWQLSEDGWFRWQNQEGIVTAESLWWNDGPVEQGAETLRTEVGEGWLVVLTQHGLQEIMKWSDELTRGGVVWRSKGWNRDKSRSCAQRLLPFER